MRILVNVGTLQGRIRLRVESRHSCHRANKHPHRMRIIPETLHQLEEVLVEICMGHNLLLPMLILGRCGEFSIDYQVCDLQECGVLRKLFDWITTVTKNAIVTIYVADFAPTHSRVQISRVVNRHASLLEYRGWNGIVVDGDSE